MLKSLCVQRVMNDEITTKLPYNYKELKNIIILKVSNLNKLHMLLEQYLLCSYTSNATLNTSSFLEKYKFEIQSLGNQISSKCDVPGLETTYSKLYNSFRNFVYEDKVDSSLTEFFYDNEFINPKSKMLPKAFVFNYLYSLGSGDRNTYTEGAPVLLVPIKNKDRIYYRQYGFNYIDFTKPVPNTLEQSSTLNYIHRLDWTGQPFLKILATIQNFNVIPTATTTTALASYISKMFMNDISRVNTKDSVSSGILRILEYHLDNNDVKLSRKDLAFILKGIGYSDDILEYVLSENATLYAREQFTNRYELSFISRIPRFAEEDEFTSSETEETEELDVTSDEDFGDMSDDDTDFESMDDDAGSDDSFGDDSFDDGGFGDDSDSGDMDSDSGEAEAKEDEVKVPTDPLSVVFDIVDTETQNEFLERNTLISLLTSIVANPPEHISSAKVKFLEVWLSQFISKVSIDTTKQILSRLGIKS